MTEESRDLVLAPEFVVPAGKIASRINELQSFVKQYMVEGEDFGTIPGTAKPTLYKPGAEKLCDIYGFQRMFDTMNRVEDWDKGLFHYEVRASLVDARTGLTVAQGLGSANSKEARYRWRHAERACPVCREAAIIKGKEEYGGGWVCFKKKGGCGATFSDDDPAIVDQQVGRVENDDPFTLVNTLLKMAKKRALVDAVLSATRSSGLFTQDMEDIVVAAPVEEPRNEPAATPRPPARKAAPKQPPRETAPSDDDGRSLLFGLATEMWPDKDTHAAICAGLSLPSDGEGAIREHWLDKGGTYKGAQPLLAEVRRQEVGGKSFEDAARIVNAYAQLTEGANE